MEEVDRWEVLAWLMDGWTDTIVENFEYIIVLADNYRKLCNDEM